MTLADLRSDEAAYILIEEARLRCEGFRPRIGRELSGWFVALHREIGISGYFASERILAPRRVELLGIAAIRSTESDCTSPLDAIASLMLLALSAAERALASLDSGDHIHLTHVHLLMAAELIADSSGWDAKLLQVDQ
jgi:hypothetical protein